ncbi:phosphatidylglycerophosphatase A [Bordetella sp. 15P40C-2]|uniref:phosphatidylglycerophosphatase A family protein n=1 Tax=Bordetella sp. 15P40C-2 TaxID=2572246 RepID=UPI00132321A8|nr:phosphatidylglycerophosphatase A [Bordetella sp. 15P40C-2]MVW71704.1 phosphatidylglycerophosphatase A [Bordetella sp. 15P40C-2]
MRERVKVAYPSFDWVRAEPARLVAFGFGSGLIRPASGTWGTLLAWLIWAVVAGFLSDLVIGVALVALFAYGCWACQRASRQLHVDDHVGIVCDEMVAFWLVLWLTPDSFFAQLLAFGLFRLFDIAKPPPIKYFDSRIKGGFGVMWDDIVAAAYSLFVMAIAVRLGVFA